MTLTMTAVAAYADTPRVDLNVTSSPAVTGSVVVWRVHEDGTKHKVLTEPNPVVVGSWAGFDYHAPFNEIVTYYAVAVGLTSAVTAPVVLGSDTLWFIHASDPSLSVLVDAVITVAPYVYESRAVEFQVLGARLPTHRSVGPRGGKSGSITVWCPDGSGAVLDLLADGRQFLVNNYIGGLTWMWVQPGDVSDASPVQAKQTLTERQVSFPWKETTQPDADNRLWTYAELGAAWPGITYAQLATHYASYSNLKLDVRVP